PGFLGSKVRRFEGSKVERFRTFELSNFRTFEREDRTMVAIGFFKGQPTDYIIKFVGGRPTREGLGLAFFYLPHNTHIVAVPTQSTDVSFVFNEVTNNFQAVTIQGQLTYRVRNPLELAGLLNFTIDPRTKEYVSEDPDRLAQRITNIVQTETRAEIQRRS